MLYAGQEVGERGMDKEGFSGVDGRTTIFDYWCVDTIYRGYFDRRKQKKEEKDLVSIYQIVNVLSNKEKAIREGVTFDLMYVNQSIANRQFAFLRSAGKETLLIVVNFSDESKEVDILLPSHAFDYLHIPECETTAIDLLTKETLKLVLRKDRSVRVVLKPWSGRVYKMKF